MAKTIKEIADELGVSKTAVSKQIANLGLRSSLRKNGNQFAIENQQEKLIKMAFQKKRQQEIVGSAGNCACGAGPPRWDNPAAAFRWGRSCSCQRA